MMVNLGANTVHFSVEMLEQYELARAEVCMGREGTLSSRQKKAIDEIKLANELGIPVSVHLPIFLPPDYKRDYLDAMFLEPDEAQRELSFEMVALNLKLLESYEVEYYVLHFPGVILEKEVQELFEERLDESLERLEALSRQYNCSILLEYFGSNVNFYRPEQWIEKLRPYRHLGLLIDTGHLYFASVIWDFDFISVLKMLSDHAEAFHLWTTKGQYAYRENEFYLKNNHVAIHPEQMKEDGWAFDSKTVLDILKDTSKPLIIEATPLYLGEKYYQNGIVKVASYLKNVK